MEDVVSSDKASGKIPLHNILKGESDGVNEVLNLLHKNKLLEEDLHNANMKAEELKIINEQNEAKLTGLSKLQSERKDAAKKQVLDSRTSKDQSERIKALVRKLKSTEVELNTLKNERGDFYKLKSEFEQAKKIIMTHDIIPDMYDVLSKYDENIPIQIIKSMLLTMHHKYNEHILNLFGNIDEMSQKLKNSNDVALKSQFYLRATMTENNKLKNTIKKYVVDLKEKRKEEMELLERIINTSMKKYNTVQHTEPNQDVDQADIKGNENKKQSKSTGKSKKSRGPSKSPIRQKPAVSEDPTPNAKHSEEKSIKEVSQPITLESHTAALQRRVYVLRNENDKLKLDLHNSTQNYLEVKDQYMALQEVLNQSVRTDAHRFPVGDHTFIEHKKQFKQTIQKLDAIMNDELSVKEYENLITDGKLKNTVSNDKKLYESMQNLITKAQAQQEQCKLK